MDVINIFKKVMGSKNNSCTNDKQKLLFDQAISQHQIFSLLNTSADSILCGPDCQKSKITGELEKKYLDAKTNIQTAPIELENTKKNYYVYSKGEPYYDNMLEDELKAKVDKIAILITESFNDELDNANTMNKYLNISIINSRNTKELLANFKKRNNSLEDSLDYRNSDILTNDRKTYYENNALTNLKGWYFLWWYIYYILCIVISLSLFLVPNLLSLFIKIIIIILILGYPYFIPMIITYLNSIILNINSELPTNIYSRL
jgi:hypothetical protein